MVPTPFPPHHHNPSLPMCHPLSLYFDSSSPASWRREKSQREKGVILLRHKFHQTDGCRPVVCSLGFLFIPWLFLEKDVLDVTQISSNIWIFLSNAFCALALNLIVFLVIGRTSAVTVRVAGVLKDWILIALSTLVFPESSITGLNAAGYSIGTRNSQLLL